MSHNAQVQYKDFVNLNSKEFYKPQKTFNRAGFMNSH